MKKPKVLLAGRNANVHSGIARRLTSWGAECQFASCCAETRSLLKKQAFDAVISQMKLADGSALSLAPLLEESASSLFCFYPIEDSCLWIPVVVSGVYWGGPALRPREFSRLLHQTFFGGTAQPPFRRRQS